MGGKTYRPGTGYEAFAAVKDAPVLSDERNKGSSATGNEVLTPTFVTLMHELGHVLKIASGTCMSKTDSAGELKETFLPGTEGEHWQGFYGLEEKVNVFGVENPIRKESGISTRDVYETPEDMKVARIKNSARVETKAFRGRNPNIDLYLPNLLVAESELQSAKSSEIDTKYVTLQGILGTRNEDLLAKKRAFIVEQRTRFRTFVQKLPPTDSRRIQRTQRYKQLEVCFEKLIDGNEVALGKPQCVVQDQVTKFIMDKNQLIAAGVKIRSVEKHGRWSPRNWFGTEADEGKA